MVAYVLAQASQSSVVGTLGSACAPLLLAREPEVYALLVACEPVACESVVVYEPEVYALLVVCELVACERVVCALVLASEQVVCTLVACE